MVVEIKNLSKAYGKKTALKNFSCTLAPGICGLIGHNGAGKSTLMKLISDNLKADTGAILYNGKDIIKLGPAFRKALGYMPQQQGMYEGMSLCSFLHYMATLKGIRAKEATRQIDELLDVTNLSKERFQKLRTFSGGMKQRAMLAQALLGNPQVILLDEPTVGLDPQERIRLREKKKKNSEGKIVLWSTHIVNEIEEEADTILMMKKGELLMHKPIAEVLQTGKGQTLEEVYLYKMSDDHE